ncbi:unnamed protein product [Gadus morhua 'NCC']
MGLQGTPSSTRGVNLRSGGSASPTPCSAVQSCGSTAGSTQVRGLTEWGRGHGQEKPTHSDDNKPPYDETQPPRTSLHTSIVSPSFIRLQAKEFGETCQLQARPVDQSPQCRPGPWTSPPSAGPARGPVPPVQARPVDQDTGGINPLVSRTHEAMVTSARPV